MKYPLVTLTVLLISLMTFAVHAFSEQKKPSDQEQASVWMEKKLQYTQNILAGLTQGDFNKISKNAEAMRFVGYLEKWERARTPEYKRQVQYFELANEELMRQASAKNIDGATLAYYQLTVSCVHCHQVVRESKK
jgi:hypothetical protein